MLEFKIDFSDAEDLPLPETINRFGRNYDVLQVTTYNGLTIGQPAYYNNLAHSKTGTLAGTVEYFYMGTDEEVRVTYVKGGGDPAFKLSSLQQLQADGYDPL